MSLKHFIDGFCICAQLHHIEYGENELQAFNRYVLQFYRDQRAISLYHCILERTTTKEEAFACFFELLHKFIHFQNGLRNLIIKDDNPF